MTEVINEKQQSSTPKNHQSRYLTLNRLPTLQEVLDRKTRPPLDLFCFYIFLQRESAEDALDFWLDVQQHENLCKAYFKDLRRSGRTVDQDWPAYAAYARANGSYFSPLLGLNSSPGQESASQFDGPSPIDGQTSPMLGNRERRDTEARAGTPTSAGPLMGQQQQQQQQQSMSRERGRFSMGHRGDRRASRAPTIIARDRAIEKHALVESAERIYLRYLLPGAEKEIYLPPTLRIHSFPMTPDDENADADGTIPDLLHAQKTYIFKALEQDAFPRFLRAKAFGNLTPLGSFVRLALGLFCLWAGFVVAFTLIFLDYEPKIRRLWLILPFTLATNLLLSSYYALSPLLVLLKQSETTPFRLIKIKEPYVHKLLMVRAAWIELVALVIMGILVVIFWAVPGKRL